MKQGSVRQNKKTHTVALDLPCASLYTPQRYNATRLIYPVCSCLDAENGLETGFHIHGRYLHNSRVNHSFSQSAPLSCHKMKAHCVVVFKEGQRCSIMVKQTKLQFLNNSWYIWVMFNQNFIVINHI